MPTVQLHGGLGNQLFQYAVGRALSIRTGSKLRLEVSRLSEEHDTPSTPRHLHLHEFCIRGQFIHDPINTNTSLKVRLKLFGLLRLISVAFATQVCRVHKDQKPQRFTPQVLDLPGNSFLYGYYQSEKYFGNIRNTLRKEISLHSELSTTNRAWKKRIETTNSVAVHVRRGDYTKRGWQLPPEYYQSAIEDIQSLYDDLDLFFFSNDMKWVRDNSDRLLPLQDFSPSVHYVNCNNAKEVSSDLILMKHCRHHIIANSTLSWWGAWLNQYDEKTILAPAYWTSTRVEDLAIIPEHWRTVDW